MDVKELQVRLSADISQLQSALGQITSSTQAAGSSISGLAAGFAAGQAAVDIFRGAMSQAKDLLTSSFTEAEQGQFSIAQLNAAIRSTGDVSGSSTKDLVDYADQLERTDAVSHVQIQTAESLLLSYTNLTDQGIKQATQAAVDMAARFGGDVSTNAQKLGQALQDPATGMMRLRSIGITLSDQQATLVKDFMKLGDTAQAQKIILDAVSEATGGAGAAAAATLGGQMNALGIAVDDAKEKMGNFLGAAIEPLVASVTSFISTHQQLVASLMAGAVAAGAAVGAIGLLIGAFLLLQAASGPLIVIFAIIATLVGVTVFSAFQSLQNQVSSSMSSATGSVGGFGNAASNSLGQVGGAASKVADQLAQIQQSIDNANASFEDSLTNIIQTHQNKVSTLQDQIDQETDNYQTADSQRLQSFQNSQASIQDSHQRTLDSLNAQLASYVGNGRMYDQIRVNDVTQKINDENQRYQDQLTQLNDQYAKDEANAKAASDKKLATLQKQLDTENAFLAKHSADVLSVEGNMYSDEIDKLKATHAKELESYAEQQKKVIDSSNATANAVIGAYGGIPGALNSKLTNPMANLGTQMGNQFTQAVIDSIKQLPQKAKDGLANVGSDLVSTIYLGVSDAIKGRSFHNDVVSSHALGGPMGGGELSVVGERGPELFRPFSAGRIIPSNQINNSSSNTVHMYIGTVNGIQDVSQIGNELNRRLNVAQRGF